MKVNSKFLKTMNITQALKEKTKIVRDMNKEWTKVKLYNIFDINETVPYSAKEAYKNWLDLKDKLVELKTRIHKANSGIAHFIFRLSECKDTLKMVYNLDCIEGIREKRLGYTEGKEMSDIKLLERDQWIKNLEQEIDDIQTQLEQYNFRTTI